LCRRGLESRFVTLMFGLMTANGALTYCNAGHNPPLVLGRTGVRRLEAGGPVVGLLPYAPFDQGTDQLEPGDVILIFSDGVSEAFNLAGEEFGEDRILEVAAAATDLPAAVLVERIVGAVRAFTRGALQGDDITAMVIRYLGTAG
jgi:sigma-B regulation protein RsbU (phosphoserine phosphatase)